MVKRRNVFVVDGRKVNVLLAERVIVTEEEHFFDCRCRMIEERSLLVVSL